MFSKMLGKKKDETDGSDALSEVSSKIVNMNLTEMRTYVNNKISTFEVSALGLLAVMNKLTLPSYASKQLYLLANDTDIKKKKAFELVLKIAKSTKIDLQVLDGIQNFMEVYKEMITQFDKDHKEIYTSRFKEALEQAIVGYGEIVALQKKMKLLGES